MGCAEEVPLALWLWQVQVGLWVSALSFISHWQRKGFVEGSGFALPWGGEGDVPVLGRPPLLSLMSNSAVLPGWS